MLSTLQYAGKGVLPDSKTTDFAICELVEAGMITKSNRISVTIETTIPDFAWSSSGARQFDGPYLLGLVNVAALQDLQFLVSNYSHSKLLLLAS